MEHAEHTFSPVYNEQSKILILGSFPSVKSRETNFYYGHPRNRFWPLLAKLTKSPLPVTIEEKKEMLLRNRIAVWDVILSCDIHGSSDSSIRNVVPADLTTILKQADIRQVFANGNKAYTLYNKYILPKTGKTVHKLPSTSPANAACSLEKLEQEWRVIYNFLPQPGQ